MRRLVLRRPPAALVAVILLALPLASYGLVEVWPSYAPPPTSTRVVFGDRVCQEPALIDAAGRVYLDLGSAETLLGRDISVDGGRGRVVLSTEGWRPGAASAEVASFLASKTLELNAPLKTSPVGDPHVPLDLLARLAGWCYTYFPESNTVVIDRLGSEVRTARVRVPRTHLFQTPSLLSLRLGTLLEGDVVRVFAESKGRLYVRDGAGRLGWVPAGDVAQEPPSVLEPGEPYRPAPPPDGQVCLVWEALSTLDLDPDDIGTLPAVNVVSPTWFHVVDTKGTVQNLADPAYVRWAHERGYRVWGLVTNGFDRDRTRAFLTDRTRREHVIRQLLAYACLYDLDGLNLDFENMYESEKDDYVAFVRELAPLARAQGLALSVDVTFISSSGVWSRCYDRPALAALVDYVVVMAYDQHTPGGPAGPVGALPWVRQGLERVLAEVPAEKLVLGVPFYTRLWEEVPGRQPKAKTYSMQGVRDLLAEKGLTPVWDAAAGQHYVTYVEEGRRYRLWVEDETSLAARASLVREYGLTGLAAWRRGFEVPEMWEVIRRELGS